MYIKMESLIERCNLDDDDDEEEEEEEEARWTRSRRSFF
jgi:hypothetical protein